MTGHGADVASGQGATTSQQPASDTPAWMPAVETGDESYRWRRAWVYDLETDQVRPVGPVRVNIWETVWCGNEKLAAVVSSNPGEGFWYGARLALIDVDSGQSRDIYRPEAQLGWPAASPSGKRMVVVEALCSDRGVVAGALRLIDMESGTVRSIDTLGVDITHAEWRSERHVLLAGHRGFEAVVSLYDVGSAALTEIWRSTETTGSGVYIAVAGIGASGDCAFVCEGFHRAPEIAVIRNGQYQTVRAFDSGYAKGVFHGSASSLWGGLCMNRSLLAALVFGACSIAGAAYAQDNPSGLYLGAGVGQFNVQIDDIDQTDDAIERLDDDDRAWKAFAGWRFGPYIAVEAAYIDFGTPNSRSDASGSSGDFRVQLSGFAPYVIGTLPLGPIELFGKIGYYFYDVDLRVDIDDPLAPDIDSSESDEDLLYGGGIGATFIQRLNVRLEYERLDSDVVDDADALWLSGSWRF